MKSLAHAKLKRTRAVELLANGCTYDEIARRLGFAHRGSAHRAVSKALAEREVEDVDMLRALQLGRLDRIQLALWEKVLEGDVSAVNAALRVIDQRSRLLGLYSGARTSASGSNLVALVVDGIAEGNTGETTVAAVTERLARCPSREPEVLVHGCDDAEGRHPETA